MKCNRELNGNNYVVVITFKQEYATVESCSMESFISTEMKWGGLQNPLQSSKVTTLYDEVIGYTPTAL